MILPRRELFMDCIFQTLKKYFETNWTRWLVEQNEISSHRSPGAGISGIPGQGSKWGRQISSSNPGGNEIHGQKDVIKASSFWLMNLIEKPNWNKPRDLWLIARNRTRVPLACFYFPASINFWFNQTDIKSQSQQHN